MALNVYPPGDFRIDRGDQGRLYPIEDEPEIEEIVYDSIIQNSAYIQANIVAVFDEWIRSFFDPNYFTFTRIKTESSLSAFKSFMKQIYKKDQPFLVIDPTNIEHVEDSLFGQNMIGRYNSIDPQNDVFSSKLLYSLSIMKSDMFELVYRRNRYKFNFDIMIMERTMHRQINTYNRLLMNVRHNSKFLLHRTIPHLLPSEYIRNIANLHGFDWKSEAFVTFLNSISQYPIIRRILPSGNYLFFMQQDLNIQVEVPGLPSKDTPETSEAIEWGARIVDTFDFIVDLPTEFLFLLPMKYMTKYDRSIPADPDAISYISPIHADMDWPKEINGYTLSNRVDIMIQSGDDNPSINLIPVIKDYNSDIYEIITEFIEKEGKLHDLIIVRVYPNGSMKEASYAFDNAGNLSMHDPVLDKLYTVNIYLNLKLINMIGKGKHTEYIGDIEKY